MLARAVQAARETGPRMRVGDDAVAQHRGEAVAGALQARGRVVVVSLRIQDRDSHPPCGQARVQVPVEEKAMHDVGAPGANMPAQAPDQRRVELSTLLIHDKLDVASRQLVDPAGFAGQRVDARLVPQAHELPGKQDSLALGAAEG
jgi:hypothetical protein